MSFCMVLVMRHPEIRAFSPYQVTSIRSNDRNESFIMLSDTTWIKTHMEPGEVSEIIARAAAGERNVTMNHEPQ